MKLSSIADSVIGANTTITTPFGDKPLIYADYTASGRSLSFIEDYIRSTVMPHYANTHTEFSYTGSQTTRYREQARDIIHEAVNGSEDDKVIFCGSGATAAIDKLIAILGIRIPCCLDDKFDLESQIPESQRPVVFVGPYEHHSNELPWRESIATVVAIPEDDEGKIDCQCLQAKLKEYAERPLKIGSFSAASNVTGIRSEVQTITAILHQQGALSFWDYAAAAPYVRIDMNGEEAIDAVFFSPHKFVGGPGTPGVLIIKQSLLNNRVPAVVGGGTVAFVTPENHRYLENPVEREEAGTPAIIEAIRAGLVVKLQQDVGVDRIEALETEKVRHAINFIDELDNVEILGNTKVERISIFSLRFRHGQFDLHHGFVTSLFNDLFGIQMRGGCSCAGPYGHYLLDIDQKHSLRLSRIVGEGYGCMKPGWVRFNLNYFISSNELDYILQAIKLVSEYGYKLLPYYKLDEKSGIWRFQEQMANFNSALSDLNFNQIPEQVIEVSAIDYDQHLEAAREVMLARHNDKRRYLNQFPDHVASLRWFLTASDLKDTQEMVAGL